MNLAETNTTINQKHCVVSLKALNRLITFKCNNVFSIKCTTVANVDLCMINKMFNKYKNE